MCRVPDRRTPTLMEDPQVPSLVAVRESSVPASTRGVVGSPKCVSSHLAKTRDKSFFGHAGWRRQTPGMTKPTSRRTRTRELPLQGIARWQLGPRTRAWDELWRWLLSDLSSDGVGITDDSKRDARGH